MKKLLITMSIVLAGSVVRAQSIDQLLEQLALDIQKLSQLKTILQDMKDSYKIINEGYGAIRDIAQGNFSLHKLFLDGLLAVNPTVRNYYRVTAILETERSLVSEYSTAYRQWSEAGCFSAEELEYIRRSYQGMFDRSNSLLDELTMVLTANELRMSDAQRMSAIDRMYETLQSQLNTARKWNGQTSLLMLYRKRTLSNQKIIQKLYGNSD